MYSREELGTAGEERKGREELEEVFIRVDSRGRSGEMRNELERRPRDPVEDVIPLERIPLGVIEPGSQSAIDKKRSVVVSFFMLRRDNGGL